MLKEENNRQITTNCISCLPLVWIVCPKENHGVGAIMAPITEEQEKDLDNGGSIIIKDQFDKTYLVEPKFCYAYGKLDLSPKSDDLQKIVKADWFKNLYVNIIVFTKYDYDSHTVTSDIEGGRWYETNNIDNYLPFLYGKIGKPERVVIFRKDFDSIIFKNRKKNTNKQANRKHYLNSKDYYQSYTKRKTELKRKAKVSNLQFTIKK